MTHWRTVDGVVEAVQRSTVSAQTSGRIVAVQFDVDQFVREGEVIVRFRDTEQKAALAEAQAALREAQARAKDATAEFERVQNMFQRKLVAEAEFDRAKAGLESARARVEAARARLNQAREQLDYTTVKAPYSGIVVERHVEVGETAQVGEPLMTGLSLEALRVNVPVPQSGIGALRQHRSATVILPDGGEIAAESLTIFPYADPESHTFKVRVQLPEGQRGLYPGMFVKVAFKTGEDQRLTVPASAVVHRSEVTAVYVLEAGRVSMRQVRAGRRLDDQRVEILAGLEEGEQVALDPIQAGVVLKGQPGADHE